LLAIQNYYTDLSRSEHILAALHQTNYTTCLLQH